jgi:uncharacterized protein (TIRG00374 family)
MQPSLKKRLSFFVKATFVFGLLYFLTKKGFISMQATRQALERTDDIIPAFVVFTISMCLGIVRWQWLLRAQNINLPWLRTAELTLIGNFFNIALPGAVSGDFVKAFYVGKEIAQPPSVAFGSILFDRVMGLCALVLVAATAFTLGIGSFWDSPLRLGVQFALTGAAIGVIAFLAYLFLVREHHDPLLIALRKLEKRWPKTAVAVRVYEGTRHYHNHRLTVLKALAISGVIHLMVGWVCFKYAHALDGTTLPLLSIYVVVPLGLLVTAVPIFPAGVGTGHASFLYLFGLIGSKRGADVFSLYAISSVALSSLGGLVYLRFKSEGNLSPALE